MGRRLTVASSESAVLGLRDIWERLPLSRPDSDLDYFLAVVRSRPEVERPHVIVVESHGTPTGFLAGRIERVTLETRIGYRSVYRPVVRALTVVHGGVVATGGSEDLVGIRDSLLETLRQNDADLVLFPSLRCGSQEDRVFQAMAGPLRRQHLVQTSLHRRLELPGTLDEFLASRSRKIRFGIRYDTKKLLEAFGDELRIAPIHECEDLDRIISDLAAISQETYQRALGVSFSDTVESRSLTRLAIERGWFRAWVLYRHDQPIAFWQGLVYGRVYYSGTTGYDPQYRRFRVGIYLLTRVIEDLCLDPEVDFLDFGLGDADYKRQLASESWEERDLIVFAPTLRAMRVNLTRTAILMTTTTARRLLDRTGALDHLKRRWRQRLEPSTPAQRARHDP